MRRVFARFAALVGVAAVLGLTGCGASSSGDAGSGSKKTSGRVTIVAAESVWGELASEIAGSRAEISSIIDAPGIDPHDYEATPADARRLASARVVIINGANYDVWASQVLDVDRSDSRVVIDVAKLIKIDDGDNPHQWYSPRAVQRFIDHLSTTLTRIDPDAGEYYEQRRVRLLDGEFRAYQALIDDIAETFAGVPVGASESIAVPMVEALRLELLTPLSFLRAIEHGRGPSASDKATVDRQISERAVKVFIYNEQHATPDVERLVAKAREHDIPVVVVTETVPTKQESFMTWQVRQLRELREALRGSQ